MIVRDDDGRVGVLVLRDDSPIRLKMLRDRDELDGDLVLAEGVRLGVGFVRDGLEWIVGVRLVEGTELGGLVIRVEPWLLERVEMLGDDVEGRLRLMIGLRDELDRLRADGIDGLGAGWLLLGAEVRLRGEGIVRCGVDRGIERVEIELRLLREGIVRWGVGREIDRDGDRLGVLERDDIGARLARDEDRIEDLERLGLELRTLREGVDLCGLGRETDRDGARLGVDFGADLLALLRLLLLRELRRDDPASAARVRSRTAVTTAARMANFGLEVSFTRYILDLLSPAVFRFSGTPRPTAGTQHAT